MVLDKYSTQDGSPVEKRSPRRLLHEVTICRRLAVSVCRGPHKHSHRRSRSALVAKDRRFPTFFLGRSGRVSFYDFEFGSPPHATRELPGSISKVQPTCALVVVRFVFFVGVLPLAALFEIFHS